MAWDTETDKVQPGLLAPPIVCHSFAKPAEMQEHTPIVLLNHVGPSEVSLLMSRGCSFAGANIAYDFACLLAERPDLFSDVWKVYDEGRVFDVLIGATMVANSEGRLRDGELFDRKGAKMLDNKGRQTNRYSLYNTTLEWTGHDTAKENDRFRLSYALLRDVPLEMWPPDAIQYPQDDANNTLYCAEAQLSTGFDFSDMRIQAHAAFCAHLGAVNGIIADGKRVEALEIAFNEQYAQLHKQALKNNFYKVKKQTKKEAAAGAPIEYQKATKVIVEAVTKAYQGRPPITDKGGVSRSRETLEESGDPVLEEFAEISGIEKKLTYLPTLKAAAIAPLNVKPNIYLSTGRVSYEGMIQLMPRKGGIRDCLMARGSFCSVDYSAVELSTVSQVQIWAGLESPLAEAINQGLDPHCIIAAEMLGDTYEDVLTRVKSGDPETKGVRQAGKAGNFGYWGMMGAPKFVIAQRKQSFKVCEWIHRDGKCGSPEIGGKVIDWNGKEWVGGPLCLRCIEEADRIRTACIERWKMRKYWNWVTKNLEFTDVITQFVSKRLRGGVNGPQAANSYFQGLAADGAKRAVIALTKEMYLDRKSPLYGSRLCVFAHDETILDIPLAMDLHDAGFRQRDIMVAEMQKVCPDVKISAMPAASKYWYKDAETVYDANGRLTLWEPKAA